MASEIPSSGASHALFGDMKFKFSLTPHANVPAEPNARLCSALISEVQVFISRPTQGEGFVWIAQGNTAGPGMLGIRPGRVRTET